MTKVSRIVRILYCNMFLWEIFIIAPPCSDQLSICCCYMRGTPCPIMSFLITFLSETCRDKKCSYYHTVMLKTCALLYATKSQRNIEKKLYNLNPISKNRYCVVFFNSLFRTTLELKISKLRLSSYVKSKV